MHKGYQVCLSTMVRGRLAIAFGRKAHFPGGVIGHKTNSTWKNIYLKVAHGITYQTWYFLMTQVGGFTKQKDNFMFLRSTNILDAAHECYTYIYNTTLIKVQGSTYGPWGFGRIVNISQGQDTE